MKLGHYFQEPWASGCNLLGVWSSGGRWILASASTSSAIPRQPNLDGDKEYDPELQFSQKVVEPRRFDVPCWDRYKEWTSKQLPQGVHVLRSFDVPSSVRDK